MMNCCWVKGRSLIRGLVLGLAVWLLAGPVQAMEPALARHLLARTGFGTTPGELAALTPLAFEAAVDRLLATAHAGVVVPPPDWLDEDPLPDYQALKALPEAQRQQTNMAFIKLQRERGWELKDWWYRQMLASPSPLGERMVLFWHNHFTSSLVKVNSARLLFGQQSLLRRHALGNFAALLGEIGRDPAMLIYLDGRNSSQEQPNENYARELLELFALGEGHYTEADVKAAARAFTGWQVQGPSGRVRFVPNRHDEGEKTFLGRQGPLDGDDIVAILLQEPRTAELIVAKLWREFVSPDPDPREVQRLAALFRESGYEIRPLLRALLTTAAFRDPANRGTLIKSPAELIVGTLRTLDIPAPDKPPLARVGKQLGQDLFDPPNVRGWLGHTAWIDSDSLLGRQELLRRLTRGREMPGEQMARRADGIPEGWQALDAGQIEALLLAVPAVEPVADGVGFWERIGALVLDPAYQLK